MSTGDPLGMIGQVLHGQFRVDDLVEDGKRSFLYRGAHLMLEVPIAIKCMKAPSSGSHEQFIRRFRHESRLHYKLSQASPHVVRVLASGTAVAPNGSQLTPFMVLEWLEGQTLARDLERRRAAGQRGRTLTEAIRLLDPPVEALAFAHAHGIVHREVTPDNLFLAKVGGGQRIKLLDLGVAKILGERALDLPPPSQSMGLVPIGAPAYAAPEQYSSGVGAVGPWTDVYAIALVLLEMLMDRPVIEEGPVPMGVRVLDVARRPTPRALGLEVSNRVEAVLAQAVAARPEDRPQDAGELWGMLKNALMRDQDSLQRVSKLPVTAVPGFDSSGAPISEVTGAELPTAALLLQQERERASLPAELRETVASRDTLTTRSDSITTPRADEMAVHMARAAAAAEGRDSPETSREPPTMMVAAEDLSYDELGTKTLERMSLPRGMLETTLSSAVRPPFTEPASQGTPPREPESADENTRIMEADELRGLSLSMDPQEPVSRQAELFLLADTKVSPRGLLVDPAADAKNPDITVRNPDTTTKAPLLPPPPKPAVVPNLGTTWPVPNAATPAGAGSHPPFPFQAPGQPPFPTGAPAGQMVQQYVAPTGPFVPAGAGAPGPNGTSVQPKKKEGVSVALVAILLVLGLLVAVGAALWVAARLGWI
ncbi:serine/threonine protein kinase [Pendulispora albinea]|uniref:Serine/threonine protein kinase n=1 Tax=Pendulispora albinea TaxID=2741071 RepID=A0ABZ2LWA7_9BACT